MATFARSCITKLSLNQRIKSLCTKRNIHTTLQHYQTSTYEGDGKTKVQILNKEIELGLMINSYSQYGFRLNNELKVIGPLAIFPRSALAWNISSFDEINEDSLSLFCILEPKIDVLVLGIGDEIVSPEFTRKIISFMRKYKINVEILRTEQACATFNFLNAEQRMVAGAILPPKKMEYNANDIVQSQDRLNQLYNIDQF